MYYRDWVAKLEGKEIVPPATLTEPTYPWPTNVYSHVSLYYLCLQIQEDVNDVEYGLANYACEWASCGWLEDELAFANRGSIASDLVYATEEWLTYWDETQRRFNFPNPDDYPELWD